MVEVTASSAASVGRSGMQLCKDVTGTTWKNVSTVYSPTLSLKVIIKLIYPHMRVEAVVFRPIRLGGFFQRLGLLDAHLLEFCVKAFVKDRLS